MFKNYIKIAWRNLWKHKFYTAINILGLALSIGCSIILFQFITYHLSFDTYHQDAKRIYRVVHSVTFDDGVPLYDRGAPLVLARDLKVNNPQVEHVAVLLRMRDVTVSVHNGKGAGKRIFAEHGNIGITDGQFFNQFDYQWEQGDKHSSLRDPNSVVLSHSLATKYFGSQDVLGKTMKIDNKNIFTVTGVVKDHPANTDIKVDIFFSLSTLKDIYPDVLHAMTTNWAFINSTQDVYVRLREGVKPQRIEQDIAKMIVSALGAYAKPYHFMMQPLQDVHFDSRFGGVIQRPLLTTLGVIGVLLIVIACVNFINMATAQGFKRTKEVGIRKALGSSRQAIFMQFISETSYIVIFAAFLSFGIVALIMPVLNSWLKTQLNFSPFTDYRLLIFIATILIVIIIAAGSYPALILSKFKPVDALKNQVGSHLQIVGFTRKALIVFQNVIAQVLIISTVLITMQVNYLKTADLGFDKNSVLMVPLPDSEKSKTDYLSNQLLADPAVVNVSFCYRAPSSTSSKGGSIKYEGRDWEKFVGRTAVGDAHYLKTFGLELVAGRNVVQSDTAREYLINEMLMRKLGIKDPQEIIGRKFTAGDLSDKAGVIVGVIKDFNSKSLYYAIAPEYITTFRKLYQYAGIKLNSGNPSRAIGHIKKEWQSVYPDHVFEYWFLDQQIADFYENEDLLIKLISSSAIVAIFISCLGLLGLVSLLTQHRIKEIGVRKVLGASVINITGLLSVDFLKLVLLSIIISSPIAWLMMSRYLNNFAYRIDIEWWVFGMTALMSLLIAFFTVSFQSVKAARVNPVRSLRRD